MLTYSVLLFLSPVLKLLKKCTFALTLLFIALSAILIMRAHTVGTDTYTMLNIYMSTLSHNETMRSMAAIAPVYHIYSYFLYNIFPFPQAILICNGLLTMLCFFYFIRKFSDDKYLSIYLFVALGFYFQCFNAMRQMLALAVFLVSLSLIGSKRCKSGVIAAASAVGIHITVMIMLPLLIVFYRKKVNSALLLSGICLLVLSILLRDRILGYIASIVGQILPSYSMYINGSSIGFGNEGQGRIIWLYIFYAIIALGTYCITTISENHVYNRKTRLFMLPVLIGVSVGCLGVTNPLLARLSNYYLVFIIILIPLSLQYFKPVSRCLLYFCVMLVTMLPFYITLASNHGDVLPYKLFFLL